MNPIKIDYIKFRKFDLIKNRLLIAIDSGNSLTKVLFLSKSHINHLFNEEETHLLLQFSLFPNSEFDSALKWIKNNAFIPDDNNNYNLHVTGVYALKNLKKINELLNLNVVFINEFATIAAGHKYALEQIGVENMKVEEVHVKPHEKIENEMINKFLHAINLKIKKEIDTFEENTEFYPCLFHVHGSSSGCFYFSEKETSEYWGILQQGGKNFLGLAKCILNTNDYDEIVDLAARGNRCNVDTQVKEMFTDDMSSPYNGLPLEMPIFSFGKCMDLNKEREHFTKEDLAASLVSFHIQYMIAFCASICTIKRISKIYLTGNIFNSEVFRKELKSSTNRFPLGIEFVVLNCGYFGALGAMFCDKSNSRVTIKNFDKL